MKRFLLTIILLLTLLIVACEGNDDSSPIDDVIFEATFTEETMEDQQVFESGQVFAGDELGRVNYEIK